MALEQKYNVVIPAAGNSSRMGKPKLALLAKNKSFIEYIANSYVEIGCDRIFVVVNSKGFSIIHDKFPELHSKIVVIENKHPNWGRLHSIKLGLEECNKSIPTFIHNIDNIFFSTDIISQLLNSLSLADYSFPLYKGKGGHPVVFSPKILQGILLETDMNVSLKDILERYKKHEVVTEHAGVLSNVNTNEQYLALRKTLENS